MNILESLLLIRSNKVIHSISILIGVSVYVILFGFLACYCYGEEQRDNTMPYGNITPPVNKPQAMEDRILDRVIDMNGVVGIDGSLRILETNYTKVFDLVETSTPVVAVANHARIFLRADGTKQSLIIGWDDGTYTRIAGN